MFLVSYSLPCSHVVAVLAAVNNPVRISCMVSIVAVFGVIIAGYIENIRIFRLVRHNDARKAGSYRTG